MLRSNDDDVLKIDVFPQRLGETAIFERPQQNIEIAGWAFSNVIKVILNGRAFERRLMDPLHDYIAGGENHQLERNAFP